MIVANAVKMAQRFIVDRLSTACCVVDATAGNGFDTLFLAKTTPAKAIVWSFDIQQQALTNTYGLLEKHELSSKVKLVKECHSRIYCHVDQKVDVAMFNLGYLPGGERGLTTEAAIVLEALRRLLPLLADDGMISIVVYPGHLPGMLENEAVRNFLAQLPQKEYAVGCWSMVNQINDPPVLYLIEKKGGQA